jgi:hypothetical protein
VYQLTIIGGFTDAFHFYPVIVRDSIATIYLHNNMLEYGHTYYVTIDNGVLNLADGSFQGVTKEDEWIFTTKSDMPELSDTLIVDVAGKGDFNTVQGALDFIPDFNEQQTVILVNPLYGIERRSNCRTEIPPGSGTCRTKQPSQQTG